MCKKINPINCASDRTHCVLDRACCAQDRACCASSEDSCIPDSTCCNSSEDCCAQDRTCCYPSGDGCAPDSTCCVQNEACCASEMACRLSKELVSAAPILRQRVDNGLYDKQFERAFEANEFFTSYMVKYALHEVLSMIEQSPLLAEMIKDDVLTHHNPSASVRENTPKALIIMAGNIPLVGFHDFLCALLCGYDAVVKLSSKDSVLLPWLYGELEKLCPAVRERATFICSRSELLKVKKSDISAVLATGSSSAIDTINREFAGLPILSRNSRFSFAVLQGNETDKQLDALCNDMFLYYGLGCRSVSNLMVPCGYDFTRLIERGQVYKELLAGDRWRNCYKRGRAVAIMDGICVADGGFFILVEKGQPWVEMSEIGVWYYNDDSYIAQFEERFKENIQKKYLTFGLAQRPKVNEFADNKDSISFLLHI